jgi:sortase A
MVDKRSVEDLSLEELERLLVIKRREARQTRLRRMKQSGRVIDTGQAAPSSVQPDPASEPSDNGMKHSSASGLPSQTIQAQPDSVRVRKSVPHFEDALDDGAFKKQDARGQRIWRLFVDRSLLLVEALAVIGLIALGIAMYEGIITLQQESAAAQAAAEEQRRASIPTVAPTPALSLVNVVLPGGHTPPQDGVSTFNFEEIPSNLRGQLASQVYLPPDVSRPEPTDDTPLRVIIPAINVDHTIVQGVDWEALKLGVGQLPNGAVPSATDDNVVLSAHNDIYGEIFRYLDALEPGMEVQLQTRTETYTYVIRTTQIVEPDAVQVMEPQGSPMVTLISCYPYRVNTQRIVVFADRI